ncbi:MAG: filamentous hemagglutinin N-terminal domain-containing protein, partial [Burkholderiaceae bacterium]|nr:filamentous hemagglutinin N-terminal domain-containing protein [Burkholderiaceae bacterium]
MPFSFPTVAQAQAGGAAIAPNALPVLRGVVSGRAVVNAPVAGAARSLMTIDQSTQRAIIDWRSFNIGSASEVQFRQPNSTASALNRIYDANPSVIRGKLTANGQVLLINQNGILFDRGAQVNVQSLVASTLNLSNQRFLSGVLSAGGLTTPAFAGGYDELGNTLPARPDGTQPAPLSLGSFGDAASPAPSLKASAGGSIMLFAPNIDNNGGVIRAPDGQVILAAGNKVYLALSDDSSDLTLRGFVVEVEAPRDAAGLNLSHLIRNAGDVSADRGNVTLAALAVNQAGRISAKTAVQSNGSIYLKANARVAPAEGQPADTTAVQAGSVKFEAGSVTEVVPDAADKTTIPDSQSYLPYRGVISVAGRTIENSGTVQAAGGRISLNASDSVDPTSARVYLGAGSTTSVAGAWADVDVQKNVQSFRVTSNELRNSPDQKTSVLRGALVTVDLRQDNAILELGGYRGIVARTVAEKAAAGGELQIASSGSVVQRSGAVIDASGGGYRYGAGTVGTTKLLGEDGKIYDIATAPEQRRYTALLDRYERTSTRWNQTTSIANPLGALGVLQDAYAQGLSGGLVTINSSAGLVLDGSLLGGVTVGPRQLASAPRGATLRVGEYLPSQRNFAEGQRIGNVTVQQRASDTLGAAFGAGTALTTAQRDAFNLSADQIFGASTSSGQDLAETGFGSVELNANGRIVVASDTKIVSQVGGELILRSPQIDIAGDIRLPGGSLTVQPVVPSGDPISTELGNVTERVLVRGGADLSTAGTWVNTSNADGSFVGMPVPSGRLVATSITATTANATSVSKAIDGGNLTFQIDDPLYQARFERGSSLDVGGGASIASNKRVTGGKGGKLAIANGVGNPSTSDWLQADLRGYALGTGGELTLGLARAVIDSDAAQGVLPAATTRLGTSLFSDFGFSKITVNATDGIDITAGTPVLVQQKNWVIDPVSAAQQTSGTAIASFGSLQVLPDAQRSAASVSLAVRGGGEATQPSLNVRDGASIVTDPRGEVSLASISNLAIDGRISAPGGRIGLTLNGPVDLSAADLRIGAGSELSVAGTFVAAPNDLGLVQGSLINGGSITLDARRAGLQIDAGSILDVSGASQTVDVAMSGKQPGYTKQTLDGHAGTLTLRSQGHTVLDGTFVGQGGTTAAAGGSFVLESNRADGLSTLPDARRIVVTSGNSVVPAEVGISDAALDVAKLTASGFEKLRLQSEDRIEFRGASTLNFERGIRLDAPLIDVTDTSVVTLQGSTVSLGQTLGERQLQSTGDVPVWLMTSGTASPVLATRSGEGELRVKAGSVDLFGSITVNGARRTRIESDSDIRLVGRAITLESSSGGQQTSRQIGGLTSAGNLELVASQIAPATRTAYAFAVKDQPSGSDTAGGYIRIAGNGQAPSTLYSAGGKVSFSAETITQGGTVRAPLGAIDMKA